MTSADERHDSGRFAAWDTSGWLVPAVAGLAATAVVCMVGHPWLGPTNDPDSMNSVLYFEHLLAGHRLEITVLTTPKPLLTLLFGATWELTRSWTALVWETVAIHALGVALATRLATRIAGLPAGLFLAAALVLYPAELTEVLHANSLPYAVAGWSAAGLAVMERPARWWLAGVALLLAALARTETLLILGAATLATIWIAVPAARSRWGGRWLTWRAVAPILIGWLAIPLQAIHDLALTGNPLYTQMVPTAYTQLVTPGLPSIGPETFAHGLLLRYAVTPLLVMLGIAGFAYLFSQRRWAIGVGLAAITIGDLLLLGYLAWRGTYISSRYYEEPTLGLVLAAAIGVGGCVRIVRGWRGSPLTRLDVVVWPLVALCLAIAAPPIVGVSVGGVGDVAARARSLQAASRHLDEVAPRLREIVRTAAPVPGPVAYGAGFLKADPAGASLFVPGPLLGRIAVETGASLTRFGDLSLAFRSAPPSAVLHAGQVVYHDPLLDQPATTFRIFEIAEPARLDGGTIIPRMVAAGAYWLVSIGY